MINTLTSYVITVLSNCDHETVIMSNLGKEEETETGESNLFYCHALRGRL